MKTIPPAIRLAWLSLLTLAGGLTAFAADPAPPANPPAQKPAADKTDATSGPTRKARADAPGTPSTALKAAGALYEDVRAVTLPNGLRVYLKPIAGSPVVTTMVAYKVGSADEDLEHTGLSHYLEHLMFKGTEKIMPGDIDHMTLANGGANNAYTSEDFTIFHFDFAADHWQQALEVEADRMQNLQIDTKHEFEQEKGAVIQELERNEDQPWELENKLILPLLFGEKGPYGHPVIGLREHVRESTAAVIKAHYLRWYHPNNASLVVCGGFDAEEALEKIKQLFGPIPKVELPPRNKAEKAERDQPVVTEFPSKFELARMLMGYNAVSRDDPDYYPLEVLDAVLSGGKTGRLYKRLVQKEAIAGQINTGIDAGRYPGWFAVQVELLKGQDRKKAEEITLDELAKVRHQRISAEELSRVQQMLLTGEVFKREGVHDLADSIAQGVTLGDLDLVKEHLPKVMAVTAEDVQRVAKKYLDPKQRVVVWSVPQTDEAPGAAAGDSAGAGAAPAPAVTPMPKRSLGKAASTPGSAYSLHDSTRVVLPNGLTLLLLENHRLPIVTAVAAVHHPSFFEPKSQEGLASLTGDLLDEGTTQHTSEQIAETIENVGGTLALSEGGGSVAVLSSHRELGLGLLFECLSESNFPQDAFKRSQARQLSQIDELENQPDARAKQEFRSLVYGKHPFGRRPLGTRSVVESLKPDDCRAFYHRVFVPNNTLVALVGDFDSAQVVDEITRMTKGWEKAKLDEPKPPAIDPQSKTTERIISMPEAAQTHLFMGHLGVRRDNPDYYKLVVMDYVLGTGPGFTDRLSARVRDREGLAYTVTANVSSSAGEEPGVFACYVGCNATVYDKVKAILLEEIKRIRDQTPEPEEVADAKQYLIGNLPFQFITSAMIAGELIEVERYHLGLNYYEDYKKAIGAVTAADVQAVAKKYLDPDRLAIVAAGALDPQGKPLSPPSKAPAPVAPAPAPPASK